MESFYDDYICSKLVLLLLIFLDSSSSSSYSSSLSDESLLSEPILVSSNYYNYYYTKFSAFSKFFFYFYWTAAIFSFNWFEAYLEEKNTFLIKLFKLEVINNLQPLKERKCLIKHSCMMLLSLRLKIGSYLFFFISYISESEVKKRPSVLNYYSSFTFFYAYLL